MSVVYTARFRVRSWSALHQLSDTSLIRYARAAGVRRYRLYRNSHDAAEALLLVEASSSDALRVLRSTLLRHTEQLQPDVRAGPSGDGLWEPVACSAIE